jgi:hypothetical protein
MRLALIGLVTIAAAMAAGGQSGSAQAYNGGSFFNEKFCAMPHGGDTVSPVNDCSFQTWDQCVASARGLGRWCTTNVWWHGPRQQPTAQAKSSRRKR